MLTDSTTHTGTGQLYENDRNFLGSAVQIETGGKERKNLMDNSLNLRHTRFMFMHVLVQAVYCCYLHENQKQLSCQVLSDGTGICLVAQNIKQHNEVTLSDSKHRERVIL